MVTGSQLQVAKLAQMCPAVPRVAQGGPAVPTLIRPRTTCWHRQMSADSSDEAHLRFVPTKHCGTSNLFFEQFLAKFGHF